MICGGYHEYHGGCLVSWGTQITKDFPPTVLNTPYGTHDIPTVLNILHGTQDNPTVLMISPTVLNTPMVFKISPTLIMIFPHGTEHPYGTQDIPHGTHDIPHSTEHPHGTEHPPQYCTHIIQSGYSKSNTINCTNFY